MRMVSLFTLLLLGSFAVAQNPSENPVRKPNRLAVEIEPPPVWDKIQQLADRRGYDCAYIRSYIFERRDGEAPKLKGITTCTPARLGMKKDIGKPPQVRLIPAK